MASKKKAIKKKPSKHSSTEQACSTCKTINQRGAPCCYHCRVPLAGRKAAAKPRRR